MASTSTGGGTNPLSASWARISADHSAGARGALLADLCRQLLFRRVQQPPLELVEAADVVDVRVRAQADRLSRALAARETRQHGRQRPDTVAGVHEQVAVAAAQVPESGVQKLVHVRLA